MLAKMKRKCVFLFIFHSSFERAERIQNSVRIALFLCLINSPLINLSRDTLKRTANCPGFFLLQQNFQRGLENYCERSIILSLQIKHKSDLGRACICVDVNICQTYFCVGNFPQILLSDHRHKIMASTILTPSDFGIGDKRQRSSISWEHVCPSRPALINARCRIPIGKYRKPNYFLFSQSYILARVEFALDKRREVLIGRANKPLAERTRWKGRKNFRIKIQIWVK